MNATASDPPAARRLPTPLVAAVLVLIAAGTAMLIAVAWLASDTPPWWRRAGELPPDAPARAEALERGISRLLHDTASPHAAELREHDANAWLACRLPAWAANRGAHWASNLRAGPRLHLRDGRIRIAADLGPRFGRRIVGVSFRPELVSPGTGDSPAEPRDHTPGRTPSLFARDARVILGRLEVDPAAIPDLRAWIVRRMPRDAPFTPDVLADILAGRRPILNTAAITLNDGRIVSLETIDVADALIRFAITCP